MPNRPFVTNKDQSYNNPNARALHNVPVTKCAAVNHRRRIQCFGIRSRNYKPQYTPEGEVVKCRPHYVSDGCCCSAGSGGSDSQTGACCSKWTYGTNKQDYGRFCTNKDPSKKLEMCWQLCRRTRGDFVAGQPKPPDSGGGGSLSPPGIRDKTITVNCLPSGQSSPLTIYFNRNLLPEETVGYSLQAIGTSNTLTPMAGTVTYPNNFIVASLTFNTCTTFSIRVDTGGAISTVIINVLTTPAVTCLSRGVSSIRTNGYIGPYYPSNGGIIGVNLLDSSGAKIFPPEGGTMIVTYLSPLSFTIMDTDGNPVSVILTPATDIAMPPDKQDFFITWQAVTSTYGFAETTIQALAKLPFCDTQVPFQIPVYINAK